MEKKNRNSNLVTRLEGGGDFKPLNFVCRSEKTKYKLKFSHSAGVSLIFSSIPTGSATLPHWALTITAMSSLGRRRHGRPRCRGVGGQSWGLGNKGKEAAHETGRGDDATVVLPGLARHEDGQTIARPRPRLVQTARLDMYNHDPNNKMMYMQTHDAAVHTS